MNFEITEPYSKHDIKIRVRIEDVVKNGKVKYVAAAPADYRGSFTGSGLPFANEESAFYRTPNKGEAKVDIRNTFVVNLYMPNSYYDKEHKLVPPMLYVFYENMKGDSYKYPLRLTNPIPYRDLTYPLLRGKKECFYKMPNDLYIRSQEQMLIESAYPKQNNTHKNHWGLKSPR